ncbi:hypothetical protein QYF36_006710 [Acer negundo]|nr:hypothetical protein QYF36_006710 [Acer negundo]
MANDHPELKPAVVDIGANEIAYIFRVLPFGNRINRNKIRWNSMYTRSTNYNRLGCCYAILIRWAPDDIPATVLTPHLD